MTLTSASNVFSGATTVNGGVLAAGGAYVLSPSSDVFVGTSGTAGTLDVTAGYPKGADSSRSVLRARSTWKSASHLASSGNVSFNPGSTLDIFGTISGTEEI